MVLYYKSSTNTVRSQTTYMVLDIFDSKSFFSNFELFY